MNRMIKIIIVIAMLFSVIACSKNETIVSDEECNKFDTFVDRLPALLIKPDNTALNQLFTDPSNIDVVPELANWDYLSLDYVERDQEIFDEISKGLNAIDYDLLDESRKENYEVIAYTLEDDFDINDENYYFMTNNPLGAYDGSISNVFISLYFMEIRTELDAKSYINLLDSLNEYALNLLEFEQLRQDNGYGMSPREIELSIENIETSQEHADFKFIVDDFKEKVNASNIENKDTYINYVDENLVKDLTDFYQTCLDGLKAIDVKQGDVSLSELEEGREYYASIVYANSGFESMDEYYNYIYGMYEDSFAEFLKLVNTTDSEKFFSGDFKFTDIDNPNELLAYFKEVTRKDFPMVGDFEYEMRELPKEFGYLMPGVGAFYVIGPLDDENAKQHMMLNGTYNQSDFTTIAHEGYPGHMFQHAYANSLNLPYVRNIYNFIDYSEGYANYVEDYITRFAIDDELAHLNRVYDEYLYSMILLWDYELGYGGEDVFGEMVEVFGDAGVAKGIYEQIKFSPGTFIPYYVAGSIFNDMYDEIENKMSLKEFHESILSHGPMPLNILREKVQKDAEK